MCVHINNFTFILAALRTSDWSLFYLPSFLTIYVYLSIFTNTLAVALPALLRYTSPICPSVLFFLWGVFGAGSWRSGPSDALVDKCLLYPRATPVGYCRGMLILQLPPNTDDLHLRPSPLGAGLCMCAWCWWVCVRLWGLTDEATGGPATRVCVWVCAGCGGWEKQFYFVCECVCWCVRVESSLRDAVRATGPFSLASTFRSWTE